VESWWGVDTLEYPHEGSAALMWDSGSPVPPDRNQPPRDGRDPHGDPRGTPSAVEQIVHFLRTGEILDVCRTGPCEATQDD
jgi:hypothetical protein